MSASFSVWTASKTYLLSMIALIEDTLISPLFLSVGHSGLCCGRLPLWQNSPTRVCPMSRCSALWWREDCWRSHRTVLTCCKKPTHTHSHCRFTFYALMCKSINACKINWMQQSSCIHYTLCFLLVSLPWFPYCLFTQTVTWSSTAVLQHVVTGISVLFTARLFISVCSRVLWCICS